MKDYELTITENGGTENQTMFSLSLSSNSKEIHLWTDGTHYIHATSKDDLIKEVKSLIERKEVRHLREIRQWKKALEFVQGDGVKKLRDIEDVEI